MMGHGYGMGSGFGWIGMILFIALVVIGIIFLLRELDSGRGRGGTSFRARLEDDTALRVLRERYARGEIDREEFEDRKRGLE